MKKHCSRCQTSIGTRWILSFITGNHFQCRNCNSNLCISRTQGVNIFFGATTLFVGSIFVRSWGNYTFFPVSLFLLTGICFWMWLKFADVLEAAPVKSAIIRLSFLRRNADYLILLIVIILMIIIKFNQDKYFGQAILIADHGKETFLQTKYLLAE